MTDAQEANPHAPAFSRALQHPAKLRFWLPSITDLIFISLLIAFSFGALAPRLLGDAGIGWHIRDGQQILATHAIPHTDSFSVTMSGRPWYAWEWLYDVAIGAIYKRLGLDGVVLVTALLIAFTLALVLRLTLQRGGPLPITLVFFLICTIASSIHYLARPHVVSWLLTVVWFWILDSSHRNEGQTRRLYWLPVSMLLWVNLHGGFVMGFALLALYIVAGALTFLTSAEDRGRAAKQARRLVVLFVISAMASLVNPYGYKLHVHIYHYLTNGFFMRHIEEFRPASFHSLAAQFFILLLLLTMIGILAARRNLRWSDRLLIFFCTFSGLWAARNIPIAAMLLTMVGAPLFFRPSAGASRLRRFTSSMQDIELNLVSHVWPIVLILGSTVLCFHQGRLFSKQLMNAHFDENRFPTRAVDVLQARGVPEPIFSLDSWGGYFIFRLFPEVKVFVDDRHDLYGEPFLREYLKVLHVEPGWDRVLDGMGVNLVVMPTQSALTRQLRRTSQWELIYADQVAAVFTRSGSVQRLAVPRSLSQSGRKTL